MTTTAGIETRVAAPGDPAHPARAPRPRARRSDLAWWKQVIALAILVALGLLVVALQTLAHSI